MSHIPSQVIQDTPCRPGKLLVSGQGKCVQVGASQLGVVVQHLLKVWNVPELIHAVSVEAAPYLVIHASCCHLLEGELYDVKCLACIQMRRSIWHVLIHSVTEKADFVPDLVIQAAAAVC